MFAIVQHTSGQVICWLTTTSTNQTHSSIGLWCLDLSIFCCVKLLSLSPHSLWDDLALGILSDVSIRGKLVQAGYTGQTATRLR